MSDDTHDDFRQVREALEDAVMENDKYGAALATLTRLEAENAEREAEAAAVADELLDWLNLHAPMEVYPKELAGKLKTLADGESSLLAERDRLREEVEKLQKVLTHAVANKEEMSRRNRVLRSRPDIPIDHRRHEELMEERDRLAAQLGKWQSYYGADDPRDGVIGSAVGKIVGEQNVEIKRLAARCKAMEGALREIAKEDGTPYARMAEEGLRAADVLRTVAGSRK